MTLPEDAGRELDQAQQRIEIECQRAARAAEIAERHERQLMSAPASLPEFHERMAATHRRAERRHLAAARMHAAYASRLRRWVEDSDREQVPPPFMVTVAQSIGVHSAAVTLYGSDGIETLVAASDPAARSAQDLEFTLGEGPARDAADQRRPVAAAGSVLLERWSNYGPAVSALGIGAVVAVPVELARISLGALTVFDPPQQRSTDDAMESYHAAADTIALSVLLASGEAESNETPNLLSLFGETERRAAVHQAAGIVSAQCGCDIADALALIRAHAFAEGVTVEAVASDIVHRRLRLA